MTLDELKKTPEYKEFVVTGRPSEMLRGGVSFKYPKGVPAIPVPGTLQELALILDRHFDDRTRELNKKMNGL